jgi:hypothetical protein
MQHAECFIVDGNPVLLNGAAYKGKSNSERLKWFKGTNVKIFLEPFDSSSEQNRFELYW